MVKIFGVNLRWNIAAVLVCISLGASLNVAIPRSCYGSAERKLERTWIGN
jgi:hypothetical protein